MQPSDIWKAHAGSSQSEGSVLDMELERNGCNHNCCPSPLQPIASAGQHSESSAAYFSWPTSTLMHGSAEGRANYFGNLQKGVLPGHLGRLPKGQQATTLLDLMIIRAFHSNKLRRYSLGTAIGFRIRKGTLTDIPAILVFVARKVHRKWLISEQCLPSALEGPGGVWCDVDVVEFSYYGAPAPTPKEQLYDELVDGLRGSNPIIGSGSQVASLETYGTLGAIVKSRTGNKQVGFLTNRHVAVDLDYPNQKMFHPLPPNLGPGIYLGAVERATSFITDDVWYGIYAGINPETFVRADGAFIPFSDDFDIGNISTSVKGVGTIGDVKAIDLQSPIGSLIGRQVVKVGRSSGMTTGTVVAYALEYNDEKGICFFTDFLVVGENQQTFDLEGDSGSLIILTGQDGEKPQPIGIIWGGTANRGRLKLKSGQGPENWTSGVDLGRLLDLLELDLITTSEGLQEALEEQRITLTAAAAAATSTVIKSSPVAGPTEKRKIDKVYGPLAINIQQLHQDSSVTSTDEPIDLSEKPQGGSATSTDEPFGPCENVEERQFGPILIGMSPMCDSQELPLSAGKMAAALAISLVERAYGLGAITDDHRQMLLRELQSNQAELDRAMGQLIAGGFPFDLDLFRYVSQGIWQFRTAVEEIEDAIDEVIYRMLEEEVGTLSLKFVKISKGTRLERSLKRLRNVLARTQLKLDRRFTVKLRFLTHVPSTSGQPYGYPSGLATAEDISGRRQEEEDLVQWLIKDIPEGIPLPICALVGMSRTGKTTLAKNALQDPRVLDYFDFIVWVVAPFNLNTEAIATVIVEKVSTKPPSSSKMSFLVNSLMRLLEDKKLCLILEKVCDAPVDNLRKLVAILKGCKKGSKILMTTRDQSVIDGVDYAMGAAAHVINLKSQLPSQVDSEDFPESIPSNVPSSSHKCDPTSWISDGGIFGRNREMEQIIQWLTMDTDEANPFSVYALVGMAGMGKTMIAKIVCQDPRVLANFKFIVWVPVSVSFDTEAMARIILETITGRPSPYSTPSLMFNLLTDTLRYRKILLILDNVWEDSSVDKWETLVAPLKVCKKGSKILLTTRMQSVVDLADTVVGSRIEYLRIDELNENANLMLFKSRLPLQLDSEDCDNLLLIGEQIVEKIGGCPLVTILVASWLGSHMDTHHWNTILKNGWHHLEEKSIIFSSLRLSYDCLEPDLQTCFRYCSLFPKGYKFNKVELAKMWTGSGLTPFNSFKLENAGLKKTKYVDLSAKDYGEEHFDVLARKSFFYSMLETETSDGKQQEYYVLHGLMHDLAEHVSKGECARVDCGDLCSISSTTRHLYVGPCSNLRVLLQHLLEISNFTYLRTLIIHIEFGLDQETELVLGELLKKSRSLRLLHLDVPSLSCAMDSISSLIHLRYLFLLSCDEYHLQKVLELYHLQVFKFEYSTTQGANCIDPHSLCCLRSLHVPNNMSLRIQNIEKLTLLMELHGFEVVKNHDRLLCALGSLRSLRQLTLRNLQNVLNVKEVMGIKLKDKHCLKLLSLSWDKHLMDSVDQDGRIIDNLEPNKEIQLLRIHGYNGVKLPVWIQNSSLINLTSLELEYCMKWKSIPSLKELASLKHLKLENLLQLEYIGTVLEQQLEANESENASLPPFLSTLTVRWCPNLNRIPDIPCTLELLIIKHVQLAGLPGLLQRYNGQGGSAPAKSQLGFLHIESCSHLTSLNAGLLGQQEQLHSLKTLVLRHCEKLDHLPTRGFAELCHLNSLEIVACPILKHLKTEDRLLPVSLKNFDVNPCGDIKVSVLMSLQNLTSLRRLILFNCSNIEELPSVELFGTLNNLNDVSIARCINLLSLGGLGAVASMRVLSILCCNKLSSSYSTQTKCTFKLLKLTIDREALLLVEPLRSLKHTRELHISDDYAMESLPGQWLLQNTAFLHLIEIGVVDSLRSLPSEMEKLQSLQSLHIERAPLLQSLPQLPSSLQKLTIWGCDPRFLKCYAREVGSDWGRIAHIADVDIQAISEDAGINYGDDDQVQGLITPHRKYVVID